MVQRSDAMYELLRISHDNGREPWGTMYVEGHGDHWLATTMFLEQHQQDWVDALSH